MPQVLHFYSVATKHAEKFDGEIIQLLKYSRNWETHQLPKMPSGDWSSSDWPFFSQQCDCLSLRGVPVTWETHFSWCVLIQTWRTSSCGQVSQRAPFTQNRPYLTAGTQKPVAGSGRWTLLILSQTQVNPNVRYFELHHAVSSSNNQLRISKRTPFLHHWGMTGVLLHASIAQLVKPPLRTVIRGCKQDKTTVNTLHLMSKARLNPGWAHGAE